MLFVLLSCSTFTCCRVTCLRVKAEKQAAQTVWEVDHKSVQIKNVCVIAKSYKLRESFSCCMFCFVWHNRINCIARARNRCSEMLIAILAELALIVRQSHFRDPLLYPWKMNHLENLQIICWIFLPVSLWKIQHFCFIIGGSIVTR